MISAIALLAIVWHEMRVEPPVIFVVSGIAVAGMAHILGVATEPFWYL